MTVIWSRVQIFEPYPSGTLTADIIIHIKNIGFCEYVIQLIASPLQFCNHKY